MKRTFLLIVALLLAGALALWLRGPSPDATLPPAPTEPTAPAIPPAAEPSPPTATAAPADATPTETPEPTAFDAVVDALQPVSVRLQPGRSVITKSVRARVRHASPPGTAPQPIRLSARSIDCPPGTIVGVPNFEGRSPEGRRPEGSGPESLGPGPVDTITLAAGRSRTARITLQIDGSKFTSVQRRVPTRCTIELNAEATAPHNTDPTPANNVAVLELNVVDLADAERLDLPEILIESFRSTHPGRIEIHRGQATQTRQVRVMAANAGPADAVVRLRVDRGTCPAGLVGAADFDRRQPGVQDSTRIRPGHKARATIPLTAHSGTFASPNPRSPARCVVTLTLESDDGDTDPSNNRTQLTVDVFGMNP